MTQASPLEARLVEDLVTAIAAHRDDERPDELARTALDRDRGRAGGQLVGLVDGCRRAVFYNSSSYLATARPLTTGEIDARRETDSVRVGYPGQVSSYVREQDPGYWDWLHPRYRWVYD